MRRKSKAPGKRKISEMILEFAGDFIHAGATVEQRQVRLTAASSAWNIASNPPDQRQKLLDEFIAQYQRFNPRTDPVNAAAIRSDMEKLIQAKLRLFSADTRRIVSARLTRVGDSDRIETAAGTIK
jgi:hypothetical protein